MVSSVEQINLKQISMKKFALLLMVLCFTIFSFASPKQITERVYDGDIGVTQDSLVMSIVLTDSIQLADYSITNYSITEMPDAYIVKLEKQATDTTPLFFQKASNIIYKEPISIRSQVYTKRCLTKNIIYTS